MTPRQGDDFRAPRGGLPAGSPDPISERAWQGIFTLPDDVVLQTTALQGTIAEHCFDVWSAVVESFPVGRPEESPVFEALLDLADYFQAASFSALHGFYRQAFATLRAAHEMMIVTARIASSDGIEAIRAWRYDDSSDVWIQPARFVDDLARRAVIQQLNAAMAPLVFAKRNEKSGPTNRAAREGWVWDVYQRLTSTHM